MSNPAPQTWVNTALQQIFVDLTTSTVAGNYDGILVGAEIALITSWPGIGADLVFGDLTEATYDGYARETITAWTNAPYIGSDGDPSIQPAPAAYLFRPTDPNATPETIVAACLVSQAGDLISIGALEAPWEAITADDVLNLLVEMTIPTLSELGALIGEG